MNTHVGALETGKSPSKALNIGLWSAQIVLALVFAMVGGMKVALPYAELATDVPERLIRFIGVAELAGAVGLVVPALTRIAPVLTAVAAVGLATVM